MHKILFSLAVLFAISLFGAASSDKKYDKNKQLFKLLKVNLFDAQCLKHLCQKEKENVKAIINECYEEGGTLLMRACQYATDVEAIDVLLSIEGIDINLQDANGWTALMYAVKIWSSFEYSEYGRAKRAKKVLRLLKEKDLQIDLANNENQTAFDLAWLNQPDEICDEFEKLDATRNQTLGKLLISDLSRCPCFIQ